MHTGKQKQMNASYQASLVNRHIRRFTGKNTPVGRGLIATVFVVDVVVCVNK